jgi:hypothetical protein
VIILQGMDLRCWKLSSLLDSVFWMKVPFLLILILKFESKHSASAEFSPAWPPPVNIEANLPSGDPSVALLSEGMQHSLAGDLDNAIRALRAAVKMNSDSEEPLIQLSLALCTLHQDSLADTEAKRAINVAKRTTPDDELGYIETFQERQRDGRCCRLPMLFPSSTVVQEDHDSNNDNCRSLNDALNTSAMKHSIQRHRI